jgi:ferredoxin
VIPKIDIFKCNGCEICVKACPPQVMGMIRDVAVILDDLCEECGICADVCPIDAINFKLPHYEPYEVHQSYRPVR